MNNNFTLPSVVITLALGMLLYFQPLRGEMSFWRPLWPFMVVVFWVLREPHHLNIGFAWLAGLLLDVLTAGHLGLYAMAMASSVYLLLQTGQRLQHFSVWHQVVVVGLLAMFYQMVVVVIGLVFGKPADTWKMLYPVISTMCLWPLVAGLLGRLHRAEISS